MSQYALIASKLLLAFGDGFAQIENQKFTFHSRPLPTNFRNHFLKNEPNQNAGVSRLILT